MKRYEKMSKKAIVESDLIIRNYRTSDYPATLEILTALNKKYDMLFSGSVSGGGGDLFCTLLKRDGNKRYGFQQVFDKNYKQFTDADTVRKVEKLMNLYAQFEDNNGIFIELTSEMPHFKEAINKIRNKPDE